DRDAARGRVGIPLDKTVLLFVGRIQPLKAPDVLVRAVAAMVAATPSLRDTLQVVVCGGPSGSGLAHPHALEDLAVELGVRDLVRFVPPVDRVRLADWYRAADVCVVPSYSESFGLVAVEAQACGTPVVAARVGGLPTAVADGVSGLLVDGHDPQTWGRALCDVVGDRDRLERWSQAAVGHASRFGWDATADATLEVYRDAMWSRSRRLAVAGT
ncbi:MAG: glycosyltransferase, partial [Candidatus Nanopelagicales bacterium]